MKSSRILLFFFPLLLCDCANPRNRYPDVEMPEQWRVEEPQISYSDVNALWWEKFGDEQLTAYIQEGIENNKDIKIAIARVCEFYQNWIIVRSELYPQIFGVASYNRQQISLDRVPSQAPGIKRIFNDFLTTINFQYELDLWGKIRSASKAAQYDFYGQIFAQRGVVLALVTAIATTYLELRQFEEQLRIAVSTRESREESLNLAVVRYNEGLTSELEVIQARIELEDAQAAVVELEALIPQEQNLLSILLGRNPQDIPQGVTLNDLVMPLEVPSSLPSDLLEQRPDIQQAADQIIASKAHIVEAKALYYPQITLTGEYGNQSSELANLFTSRSNLWRFGGSAVETFFNAGKTTALVYLADAGTREAVYHYEQTILIAFKEVNDALIAHQKAKEELEVLRAKVKDSEMYLKLARLRYDNGETDYLNVLDAQRNLFRSQIDAAASLAHTFITLVNIYKALGGGWVVDSSTY